MDPDKPKQICAAQLETMDICIAVTKLQVFSNQNFMAFFSLLCTMHSVAVGTECKVNANFWLLRAWDFLETLFFVPEVNWVGKRLVLFLTERKVTGNYYAYVICTQHVLKTV